MFILSILIRRFYKHVMLLQSLIMRLLHIFLSLVHLLIWHFFACSARVITAHFILLNKNWCNGKLKWKQQSRHVDENRNESDSATVSSSIQEMMREKNPEKKTCTWLKIAATIDERYRSSHINWVHYKQSHKMSTKSLLIVVEEASTSKPIGK